MRYSMKWISPVAALALMVGLSGSVLRADDAPKAATGTISGSVMDKDGKPAANMTVNLWPAPAKKDAAKTAIGDRTLGKKDKGAKKDASAAAVATATTGGDGTFTMANVPVGDYKIDAGSRKDANGYGKAMVTVKEGANAEVKLTLAMPKEKKAN